MWISERRYSFRFKWRSTVSEDVRNLDISETGNFPTGMKFYNLFDIYSQEFRNRLLYRVYIAWWFHMGPAVKENSDGKYDKIFCTVPLACLRRKRDNIEEACERVKWETRVKRIRDRNGCRFVMSGVEMTVPFVLKFVVFSVCQGVESLRDETTLYRPLSRSRSKEMSFPRRELSRKAGCARLRPAWFGNIIIFIANKGNITVDHRSLLL